MSRDNKYHTTNTSSKRNDEPLTGSSDSADTIGLTQPANVGFEPVAESDTKTFLGKYPEVDPVELEKEYTTDVGTLEDGTVIGDAATAPELITLKNSNRITTQINSVTGDTMLLPPGEHLVPGHFNWNLPSGVKIKSEG